MSDNVGLSTPRGSGTSGFVQRNRAYMKPRDHVGSYANPRDFLDSEAQRARLRKPDQGILDHDRKRAIEVRVFALRDELEEKEVDEDEIERRCDELRKSLTAGTHAGGGGGGGAGSGGPPRRFKAHQVHEQAQAKIEESERLRRALHISKDYEEGGHWRRQDEKQALKRKKEEDEEERHRETAQRRRHQADDPPLRSIEMEGQSEDDGGDDDDGSRGREDGRRVRQRPGSSPGGDHRSRSRSRSRSSRGSSSEDSA